MLEVAPRLAGMYLRQRQFLIEFVGKPAALLSAGDVGNAPWFSSLPPGEQEHVSWWAARWNRDLAADELATG